MSNSPAITRSATEDSGYGATFSARQVKRSADEIVTGNYIIVSRDMYEVDRTAGREVSAAQTLGESVLVIEGARLSTASVINAATLIPNIGMISVPAIYPDILMSAVEVSWAGEHPSMVESIRVRDGRLDRFFDRLHRIERGEWDAGRGGSPDVQALSTAKAILHRLEGSQLLPRKVTAADGQVFIYFSLGERFATIEVLSGGQMLLLISDGHNLPEVTEVDAAALPSVIRQIRAHLA